MNKFRRQGVKSETPVVGSMSSGFRRDREEGQLFYISEQESKRPNIIARSSVSKSVGGAMMRVQPQQHAVQMTQIQNLNEQETQEIDYETLTLPNIGKVEIEEAGEMMDEESYIIPEDPPIDEGQCEVDTSSLHLTTEDGNVVLLLQEGEESEEGNLSEDVETLMMTSVQEQEHDGPEEEILQTMTVTDGSIVSTVPIMNDPLNVSDNSSTASYILVQIDDQGNNILLPVPSSSLASNFQTLPMMNKPSPKSFSSMHLKQHQHHHQHEHKVKPKPTRPPPQKIVEAKPFRFISTPDMEFDGFISDENFHTAYIKTTNYSQKDSNEFEEPPMKKMKESPKHTVSYGRKIESSDKNLNGKAEIVAVPAGFECGYCKQVAKDRNKIVNHICMAHKDGRTLLDCKSCGKKFYASKEIVNNLKGDLLCPNCGKEKRATTNTKYQIPSSTVTSSQNLIAQARGSLPLNPVSKTYTSIPHSAAGSSESFKKLSVSPEPKGSKTTKFMCDFPGCGKKFNTKFTFVKHKLVHADSTQKPYNCEICDLEFKYKSSFLSHFNTHFEQSETQEESFFNCGKCSAIFKTSDLLSHHQTLHHLTNSRFQFVEEQDPLGILEPTQVFCHVCDDVFESREILSKHLEEKHSNKSDRPPLSDEKILNIVKKMKMGDRAAPELKFEVRAVPSPQKESSVVLIESALIASPPISPSNETNALKSTTDVEIKHENVIGPEKVEEKQVIPIKKRGRKSSTKHSMYLDTTCSSNVNEETPPIVLLAYDEEPKLPEKKSEETKVEKRNRGRPAKKTIPPKKDTKEEAKEKINPKDEPIAQSLNTSEIHVKRGRGRPKKIDSSNESKMTKSDIEVKAEKTKDDDKEEKAKGESKSESEGNEVKRKPGRPGRPKKTQVVSSQQKNSKSDEQNKGATIGSRSLRSQKSDSEFKQELSPRTRKSAVGNKPKQGTEPTESKSPSKSSPAKVKIEPEEIQKRSGGKLEKSLKEPEKEAEEKGKGDAHDVETESNYSALRKYAQGIKEGDTSGGKSSRRSPSKSNESPKELEDSFVKIFKQVKIPGRKSGSSSP